MTANDEWPVVGAALGFPTLLSDSMGHSIVSSPATGLRLQQLYQATLRHFDQVYVSSTQARGLQTSGQAPQQPPQQQVELARPAEADHETLLVDVPSEASPALTSEVTRLLLPQFSGTPGAELGMTGAPQRIIASVEQNRERLQHLAHSQNGFCAGLGTTRPENAQAAAIARLGQGFGDQGVVHPSVRSIPNYRQQLPPQQVRLVFLHSTFESQHHGLGVHAYSQRVSLRVNRFLNTFVYANPRVHTLYHDIQIMCIACGGPIISNSFLLRLMPHTHISETPLLQVFCAQVPQRATTQQQGCQRFATTQVPPHHIQLLSEQSLSQQMSIQNNPLQLVVQLQDPSHAHQFSMLVPQGQPQHNDPGFASRMRQNLNHSGMGHPQGQVSFQESFVQNSLSVPLADIQVFSTPSTPQAHPPPGHQVPVQSTNFTDLPLPQLRTIYAQMIHMWTEGEKCLQASGTSGGEGDIQRRQQLRLKLDTYKQSMLALQEIIINKERTRWVTLSLLGNML